MNEKIILGMVAPYLNNGSITYDDFDCIFSMLSKREQYDVVEILIKNNINLTESYEEDEQSEPIVDGDVTDNSFEVLYDEDLFTNEYYDEDGEAESQKQDNEAESQKQDNEYLKIRKVKISNEQLIKLIQEGNKQAKQDLCIKNMGLVKEWVSKYRKLYENKLDYEDLEQAGMAGMLKAAEKYDFSLYTHFSTYAVWWIRQSISRTIMDEGFTIRIPVHKMEQIARVARLDSKYIAVEDYYERLELIGKELNMPIEEIENCLILRMHFLNSKSLDVPVGEEMDTPLRDLIPDENGIDVEEAAMYSALKEMLAEVVGTLTNREQMVLRLRFGLDGGRPLTLEEVGEEFHLTRERIRQIEAKALRKLRHPSRSRKLKDFL